MTSFETNPTVEWKRRRKSLLHCSLCGPHRGENIRKGSKLYQKSWKERGRGPRYALRHLRHAWLTRLERSLLRR